MGTNFKKYYQTLNLFYYTILFSLIIFLAMVYFLTKQNIFSLDRDISLITVGFFVSVFSYLLANYINSLLLEKAIIEDGAPAKFRVFRHLFISKLAIYEMAGIVNTVLFLMTENKFFLIFIGYAILMILLMKPNPDKMIEDLLLTYSERTYIQEPEKTFE